jgi:hypothetical protein
MMSNGPTFLLALLTGERPPDLSDLRDITGIERLPVAPVDFSWWPWIAVGLVLVLALALSAWRWWRGGRSARKPSADEQALSELDRLERSEIEDERYYMELSRLWRRYIVARFGIRATVQTTEEFVADSLSSDVFSNQQRQSLMRFLRVSDLAKFAQGRSSAAERREAAATVRTFIREASGRVDRPALMEASVKKSAIAGPNGVGDSFERKTPSREEG